MLLTALHNTSERIINHSVHIVPKFLVSVQLQLLQLAGKIFGRVIIVCILLHRPQSSSESGVAHQTSKMICILLTEHSVLHTLEYVSLIMLNYGTKFCQKCVLFHHLVEQTFSLFQ